MLGFWIAAAVLSAATGAAMLLFARRGASAGAAGQQDPTTSAYERQLHEVDDLAARGLLGPHEREAARAEAARRLLQAARRSSTPSQPGRTARWAAPALAAAAPLLAMVIYLGVGRPALPDQPFRERVAQWRAAPERLGPAEAAAVLESVVRERPRDAEAQGLLGRARLAAGDRFGAVTALETAAGLEPGRSARWIDLAQALLSMESPAVAEARRALARAQAADPADLNVRYWLGRADVAEGNPAAAAQRWRALMADLPASDARRSALLADLEALETSSASADPDVAGMVEGLARRLEQSPDDPAGWARLARAYAVLGREQELQAALSRARRLFAERPEVLARVEAEAQAGRRLQQGR